MFELETIMLFLLASLAINLSPGPSILYATTVAISSGTRAALVSVSGMSVGVFVHVLAAATGVAALIAASAFAFTVIKILGAIYLVYLGVKTLLQPRSAPQQAKPEVPKVTRAYFYKGILVDLLNPKIGLFFLAFLPQFVGAGEGNIFVRTMVLGMLFITLGWVVNSCIAVVAAKGANLAQTRARDWIERWIPGAVLLGLGLRLATEEA